MLTVFFDSLTPLIPKFDAAAEQIIDDAEAAPLVRSQYRADHWATPKVV